MKVFSFLKREKWTVLSVLLTLICVFVGGGVLMADATVIAPGSTPSPGNAGEPTQLPGSPTTVSGVSDATGGVGGGNLIQPDIDDDIFQIGTDETVLDGIMRKAKKKVRVTGFEVDHFVIDEQKSSVFTTEDYAAGGDRCRHSRADDFCGAELFEHGRRYGAAVEYAAADLHEQLHRRVLAVSVVGCAGCDPRFPDGLESAGNPPGLR